MGPQNKLADSVVAPCNEKTDFTGAGSVAYCVELEKYLSFLSGEKSVPRIERLRAKVNLVKRVP